MPPGDVLALEPPLRPRRALPDRLRRGRGLSEAIAERLRAAPSLLGLAPELIARLARTAQAARAAGGEALLSEGRRGERVYLILGGEVAVLKGEGGPRELLRRVGPGSLFGESALSGRAERARYEAAGEVSLLFWDREALRGPADAEREELESGELRRQLRTRLSIEPRRWELWQMLRASPLFRGTSPQMTGWLLGAAALVPFRRGELLFREGEVGDRMLVVVRGELTIRHGPEGRLLAVRHQGQAVGEIALLSGGPRTASVIAGSDGEALLLRRETFDSLRRDDPAFRRMIHAVAAERLEELDPSAAEERDLVLLCNRSEHEAEGLALGIGQHLSARFGETTLVLSLRERQGPGEEAKAERPFEGVEHLRVPLPEGGEVELAALLGERRADLVLVTVAPALAPRLTPRLLPQVSTVTFLCRDTEEPFPFEGAAHKLVRHVALGPPRPHAIGPRAIGRRGALRIDLGVRPGALPRELARASVATQEAIGRLARAVTQREVGVALGGGAAWGWAHLPLLYGLRARGLPIDMIAGTSFGACVAASYASLGLEGLDRILEHKLPIAATSLLGGYSMRPWGSVFERVVAHERIEELPTPLFVVATDVLAGEPRVFRDGKIGEALRATSSLPGMSATTVLGGRRYVDGCVVDNVPVRCLREEGADFVIASNVVPKLAPLPAERHDSLLHRALSELSPLRRWRDGVRSYYLQAHLLGDRSQDAEVQFSPDLSEIPIPEYTYADRVIELARREVEPVLDEAESRFLALARRGRERGGQKPGVPSIRSAPRRPLWEKRPELRADGPPNFFLRSYLRGLRLCDRYFRYEVEGYERLLEARSSLIVAYHGRPFAWDMGMLSTRMYDQLGYYPRTFSSKGLRHIPIYREVAHAFGALYEPPDREEMARIKAAGHHLVVMPGGMREAVRPFWIRYAVDFGPRRGYLRFALEHDLPILPVVATGVDDAYLGLNDGYALSKLLTGTSYYSAWAGLGIGGFYPTALPFPVRIRQRIGAPIELAAMRREGEPEEEFLERANAHVVGVMQTTLDAMRAEERCPFW